MGNDEIGYLKYLPAFILVEILMYHQAGSDRHSEKIKQNNNVRVSKIPQSIYWIFVDAHSEISLNPGPHTSHPLVLNYKPSFKNYGTKTFSESLKVSFSSVLL